MSNAQPATKLPWKRMQWAGVPVLEGETAVASFMDEQDCHYAMEVCNAYPELQAKLATLTAEVARLQTKLDEQRHTADICAHVIIESDFPTGNVCRCEACVEVAKRMDEAGYMEHVKDRWWDAAALADTEQQEGGE